MADLKPELIRNVAILGVGGAGKTSLVESFLFKTGATTRLGTIQDGTSHSDYSPEEKEVKHSLFTSLQSVEHKGCHINLLDTPGYPDYVGEAHVALAAADACLLVLDAAGSVNANVRRLYQATRDLGLPVLIVVNRMDHDQANLDHILEMAKSLLGPECNQVCQPDGQGAAFSAARSLMDEGADADLRSGFIEALVETDEAAMEKYLEEGEVSTDEVRRLYGEAVRTQALVPVLVSCATKEIGTTELLDHMVDFLPSPLAAFGRKGTKGEEEVTVRAGEWDSTCVQVFKTVTDPYVGRLSYLRVWAGSIQSDHPLVLQRSGKPEKLVNLLRVQGKETEHVTQAGPGEILAVAKVEHLETGDTLFDTGHEVTLAPVTVPDPMVALAMDPKSRGDEQKLSEALKKLSSEDLTFHVVRDPTTHELVISGITNLHLETMMKRLKERFGVEVESRVPRVSLKETIVSKADGHHRHKKQTGGAGQFGEVYLKIEPTERGAGFEFKDEVVGASIPKNFMPAVEKGIRAAIETGVFAGYPVVDVCVKVYDGKHHPVDSNETSFKTAGAKAFRDAFLKAKPCLLEPIVDLEVEVPASAMGDITGDLNSRRGRIQGMDTVGNLQIIRAQVPLREIQSYSTDLRSMTAGEGSFHFTVSHYDIVPARVAEEIRSGFKVEDDD